MRSGRGSRSIVHAGISLAAAVSVVATVGAIPAEAKADFYRPPVSFDPTPGAVIRTDTVPLVLNSEGGVKGVPARATRILYTSTRQDGTPTVVSGYLVNPTVPWTGGGPRPTVVIAPGTMGQGDQCPSSKSLSEPMSIDPAKPSATMNANGADIAAFVADGVRVVVTDYIGLGTPGIHTYANRVESGNAVIDAARAGLTASAAPANAPVGFYGYSQGGGATASAAELAADYAPELNIKGTFAGAPPADLAQVMKQIDGTTIAGAIGYAINGLTARYPELAAIIKAETNEHGKQVLATVAGQCIGDTAAGYRFARTEQWTRTGEPLSAVVSRHPAARKAVDDQRIGRRTPNAPVLLAVGDNDDVIPAGQVTRLYRDWQGRGADVAIIRDHTPPVLTGSVIGHVMPIQTVSDPAYAFLLGEFSSR